MHPPLFVRPLSDDEHRRIREALRSPVALTRRRAQVLRLSAQGRTPPEIADALGCAKQTVRNALHAFEARGLPSLTARKSGPRAPERVLGPPEAERLVALAHRSPREFGQPRSTWTLPLLAEVAFEQGLTPRAVSRETVRQAILALGHSWQRARDWVRSPDAQYALKKNSGTA
jgi:transposase